MRRAVYAWRLLREFGSYAVVNRAYWVIPLIVLFLGVAGFDRRCPDYCSLHAICAFLSYSWGVDDRRNPVEPQHLCTDVSPGPTAASSASDGWSAELTSSAVGFEPVLAEVATQKLNDHVDPFCSKRP